VRNQLLACFLLSKIVACHVWVGSWPVMAQLITPLYRGRIRPLDEEKRGAEGK
jgi:hypothetical protein